MGCTHSISLVNCTFCNFVSTECCVNLVNEITEQTCSSLFCIKWIRWSVVWGWMQHNGLRLSARWTFKIHRWWWRSWSTCSTAETETTWHIRCRRRHWSWQRHSQREIRTSLNTYLWLWALWSVSQLCCHIWVHRCSSLRRPPAPPGSRGWWCWWWWSSSTLSSDTPEETHHSSPLSHSLISNPLS